MNTSAGGVTEKYYKKLVFVTTDISESQMEFQ